MRWRGGALVLLLAVFFVVAVAEDTLPAQKNGDRSDAHSGVGETGRPDETNLNKEVVHEEGGLKNDTTGNNKKDNSTEGTSVRRDEPIKEPRDKDSKATKSSPATDFLQDPLIMECDPSHRCIIEKNKFIACLKVPGEDSLALSLLMDNKGMNPIDASIMAPDYVTIAEDTVHIEANGHNETQVSVSISDAANDTAIVLKVAEETCTINIHSAIARETGPVMRMRLTSTYTLVPVFILLAVVGVCIKLRKTRKQEGGPAYQKLDTAELPVSIGGKKKLTNLISGTITGEMTGMMRRHH
ncbi:hypothetical protein EJB05_36462 [Eragrostis curvula]|uniref:DUF7356 domain-containing protein n=1 Tax=Eragrostis curvula TaxID=38414 RepID=A0A5J9U967_9POAL|nr:hypothetical protein EJB05_36462 [Eragrostis curvula]